MTRWLRLLGFGAWLIALIILAGWTYQRYRVPRASDLEVLAKPVELVAVRGGSPIRILDTGTRDAILFVSGRCPVCRSRVDELRALLASADADRRIILSVDSDSVAAAYERFLGGDTLYLFSEPREREKVFIRRVPVLMVSDDQGNVVEMTVGLRDD